MNEYYQVDDFIVEVMVDEDSYYSNPRNNCNLGTFYSWSRDYSSPDDCCYSKEEFLKKYNDKNSVILSVDISSYGYNFDYFFEEGINNTSNAYIFVEKEKIRKEYDCKKITSKIKEKVISVLSSELKEYFDWANGEVYGYIKYNGNTDEEDSCWGFIGEDIYSNGIIDYLNPALFIKNLGFFENIENCMKNTKLENVLDFFIDKYKDIFELKDIDMDFVELNYEKDDANISETFYKKDLSDELHLFFNMLKNNNQKELLDSLKYEEIK